MKELCDLGLHFLAKYLGSVFPSRRTQMLNPMNLFSGRFCCRKISFLASKMTISFSPENDFKYKVYFATAGES